MAGNEGSGWSSATPDLFDGRTWALGVEADVPLTRWAAVAGVALAVGSQVVPLDAQEHDDAVALVSHLPYALAALAAGAVDDEPHPALARSLAAGSFASLTRVAGGHATLGAAMAVGNRAAVARRARTFAAGLERLADALESDADADADVEAVFAAGLRAHAVLGAASGAPRRAELDREGLLALGRVGGRVVAVHDAGPDTVEVDLVTPEVAS
jgi:prephenate dehydrogenase